MYMWYSYSVLDEFQMHPEKKIGLLLHSHFLLPSFFLRGKRKRVRNNQLSYKIGYNWNSPSIDQISTSYFNFDIRKAFDSISFKIIYQNINWI